MCRHLAYLGPPRSLSSLLHDPPQSLERQSWKPVHQRDGAMNADGWGVGWWDPTAIAAAVRSATPPSPIVTTGNAPFASGPWLFSLNGYVVGFRGPVGEHLRRAVSEERAIGIEGTTDTEVLFALVLDRLDDGASPPEALAQVTAAVLEAAEARLNLLLCDGRSITATTCGNSLFTLRGSGLAEGGVLVASEPLDADPGWTAVPDGSAVHTTRDQGGFLPLGSYGGPP